MFNNIDKKTEVTSNNYNNELINIPINQKELSNLYVKGKYNEMTLFFIKILTHFRDYTYISVEFELMNYINIFVENFLFYVSKPDYVLNPEWAKPLIFLNPVITNLVAMSELKNTDFWIKILLGQKENFLKLLLLYNSRNTIKIERKNFFDINPDLASIWHGIYFITSISWHSRTIFENIREHLEFWDERIILNSEVVSYGYMIGTYFNPEKDRFYKRKINNLIKRYFKDLKINNNPDKKKIAIISANWRQNHVVFRNFHDLVSSLTGDYELSLIRLLAGEDVNPEVPEPHLFKHILTVSMERGEYLDFSSIMENDFIMAFYLDIGMDPVSRFISNFRIAPIQIMTYGHPVSTFGSEIDYFIGGVYSEDSENARNFYSERLILTPGAGLKINIPENYQLKGKKKQTTRFVINCSWGAHKVTYPMLQVLKEIISKSSKRLLFRFFPSMRGSNNYFIPFKIDIEEILGSENVEVFAPLKTVPYLEVCEECDLAIDSYPFGGVNSLVDNLIVKKPVISWEGWQHYNRLGSSILRQLGLAELVAISRDDYIQKVAGYINDDALRIKTTEKIKRIDLAKELEKLTDIKSFKKAIDYLIENGQQLKKENDNTPILI